MLSLRKLQTCRVILQFQMILLVHGTQMTTLFSYFGIARIWDVQYIGEYLKLIVILLYSVCDGVKTGEKLSPSNIRRMNLCFIIKLSLYKSSELC